MYRGTFYLQVESTDENKLLKILLRGGIGHYIKGNILVFQTYDDKIIRNISFEAFMFSVGEYMQVYQSMPMITTFAFSPLRLDVNDRVRIDRRWPQTNNGLWEKYKPEKRKFAKVESKPDIKVIDAYWIDEKGNQQRNLDVEHPVTLYLIVKDGTGTSGESVDFTFTDDGDGVKEVNVTGTVNNNGIIVIDNFTFKNADKDK